MIWYLLNPRYRQKVQPDTLSRRVPVLCWGSGISWVLCLLRWIYKLNWTELYLWDVSHLSVYFVLNLRGCVILPLSKCLLSVNGLKQQTFFCCVGSEELWSEADSSCSGQPIHLWQFLRELLLKPHSYGRCIRWLNKEKGTFSYYFLMLCFLFAFICCCCYKYEISSDSHQVFSKLKTRLTLHDCGDSGRIGPPWTMTSWAAPYVSTIRRASSASLTCLRDLCTSLFTPCEAAAAEWEDEEEHHALEHRSQKWKGVREHVHWPTPMIHTSTANSRVEAAAWKLVWAWPKGGTIQCGAVGAFSCCTKQ